MRVSRRQLLCAFGFGAVSWCANGQVSAPATASAVDAEERAKLLAEPNPLGVTQASFRRRFEAGMKVTAFPALAKRQIGVSRVSWSGDLLGGSSRETLGSVRAACDDANVRSVLLDPVVGVGLSASDASIRQATIERLKPWLDGARQLSCIGVSLDVRGEGTFDEQFSRSLDGLQAVIPMLKAAGLQGVIKCLGGVSSNGQFLAGLMNQLKDATIRLEPTFDSWRVSDTEEYHRIRGLELLMPFAACVLADYLALNASGTDSATFPTSYCAQRVRDDGFRGPVMMQYKGEGDELEGTLKIKKILSRYKFRP